MASSIRKKRRLLRRPWCAFAAFFGAITYYLTRHLECLHKLQDEIRARYGRYEKINTTTVQQLPYPQAMINEGLRIFSPGLQGVPPGAIIADH